MSTADETAASTGRRGEWVWLAILTAILIASIVWRPSDDGGFVFCMFRRATGIPCPGCGLTRSFCALAKGQVARSFGFHMLGPVLFVVVGAYWVRGIAAVAGLRDVVGKFDSTLIRWRLAYVLLVLMLGVWLLKLAVLVSTGELMVLARQGALFPH